METQYHSVKAVAKRFGVTQQSIYNWMARGKLASVKLGGTVRITDEAIQDFIAKGTRGAR